MSETSTPNKILSRLKMNSDLQIKLRNVAKRDNLMDTIQEKLKILNPQKKLFIQAVPLQLTPHVSKNDSKIKIDSNILSPRIPFKKLNSLKSPFAHTELVSSHIQPLKTSSLIHHKRTQFIRNKEVQPSPTPSHSGINPKQHKNHHYKRIKTLPKIQDQKPFQSKPKINISESNKNIKIKPLFSALQMGLKDIKSQHYFILEKQSNLPVIAHRSKVKIEVASLTKILTFYTIYRICLQFSVEWANEKVKIPGEVEDFPGTTASLEEGHIYTIEQLLYGLMLPSGNDAAMALAHWGGNKLREGEETSRIKAFVKRMNEEAKSLGMAESYFGNPHGLPHRDSKTTCEDMAQLCVQCLNIPIFREVVKTKIYRYKVYDPKTGRKFYLQWENTNKLLHRSGFIGIKTGITVTAGPCLASAYQFKGKTYIVIIAKSNKLSRRFKETRYLLSHCLNKISYETPVTAEQLKTLKKLRKNNMDYESDYSEEEHEFNFSSFSPQEVERRKRIITEC